MIWDTSSDSGCSLQILGGHGGGIGLLIFSPDSKFLAAALDDGTIAIYGMLPAAATAASAHASLKVIAALLTRLSSHMIPTSSLQLLLIAPSRYGTLTIASASTRSILNK